MSALADLLPDEDFRLHLTLRRGEPADFLRARDTTGSICAERARWIAAEPARYTALTPEGEPLLAELVELLRACDLSPESSPTMATLGATLEPDLLLLSPSANGEMILRGGALCFPSGWALEEKLNRPMSAIHAPVPSLNPTLANPINQLLSRLKPGVAFLRDNWGVAATDELNLHPARRIAPPALPVSLDRLWLRVEYQALIALPRTSGVLFAIRIALHRLDEVAADPAARAGFKRALLTMPAAMAAYKRIDPIRDELVRLL